MSQHAEDNARAHLVFIAAALNKLDEMPDEGFVSVELPGEMPEEMDKWTLEERLTEMPIAVLVRTEWHAPGRNREPASEYQLLLSTGGPACRILGTLNRHSDPDSATIQWQDWGEPWTDLAGQRDADEDILLRFASMFCFEED